MTVAAWIIAVLFAVPLGALPYKLGWENWTWLPPQSVAACVYIWKHVADDIYQRPLTGIGIRGPRNLHFKIPTDADGASAAYALKGREVRHPPMLLLGIGLAALLGYRRLAVST